MDGGSQPYLADPMYRRAALDDLKYTQEQLLSTLERPEITDTLGELALELHGTAQLLEPTEVIDENDGKVDTSKALDWRDKDVIPSWRCEFYCACSSRSYAGAA